MTADILKDVAEAKDKKEKNQRVVGLTSLGASIVWVTGVLMSVSPVATVGVITYCSAAAVREFVDRKGRRDVMLKQRNVAQQFGTSSDVDTINQALDSDAKQNTVRNKMAGAAVLIASAMGLSPFVVAPDASSGVFAGSILVGIFAGFMAARAIEKKAKSEIRFYGVQPILTENLVASILKERGLQDDSETGVTKPARVKIK